MHLAEGLTHNYLVITVRVLGAERQTRFLDAHSKVWGGGRKVAGSVGSGDHQW